MSATCIRAPCFAARRRCTTNSGSALSWGSCPTRPFRPLFCRMINQLAGCSDRYGGGHLRHTSLSGADRTSATAGKSRAFCAASRTSGENRSLIGPPKEPCPARNVPLTLSIGRGLFRLRSGSPRRGQNRDLVHASEQETPVILRLSEDSVAEDATHSRHSGWLQPAS